MKVCSAARKIPCTCDWWDHLPEHRNAPDTVERLFDRSMPLLKVICSSAEFYKKVLCEDEQVLFMWSYLLVSEVKGSIVQL